MRPASIRRMEIDLERARRTLDSILKQHGLSHRAASDMAGASPSTVGKFIKSNNVSIGAVALMRLAAALRERSKENILVSDLLGERPYLTPVGRRLELVRQVLCENLPERMHMSEADWTALITQTGLLPEDKARQVTDFTGVPRPFLDSGDPSGLGRVQIERLLQVALTDGQPNREALPPEPAPSASPRRQTAARKRS